MSLSIVRSTTCDHKYRSLRKATKWSPSFLKAAFFAVFSSQVSLAAFLYPQAQPDWLNECGCRR